MQIKDYLSKPQGKWALTGLFFALGVFLFLRACTPHDLFEHDYTIGQDITWRSVSLNGREKNFAAFNSDFLAKVGQLEKIHFHLVSGQTNDLMRDLEKGKIDGLLTSEKPTPQNSTLYYFSDPYYLTGPVLILPSTAPIKGWNDKAQKIIGVQSRSPAIIELEKDPTVQLRLYDDILDALSDLSKRRIDGALFPALAAHVYVSTFYPDSLKVATLPLNKDGVRLMTLKNKDGKKLTEAFDDAFKKLKDDESYVKLLARWGLVNVSEFKP